MTNYLSKILFQLYEIKQSKFRSLIRYIILKLEGGYMWSPTIRKIYSKYYNISVGYGSYGAMFNIPSAFKPGTIIGNYCSFASNISHFNANHPSKELTTHPILYSPICGYLINEKLTRTNLIIGHDVWIGQGAIILAGVKSIGNGAIIGAGSIVTKSVSSYTIVAGNPAKVIGSRFNEDIIKKLEESQWWNLSKDELIKQIDSLKLNISSDLKNNFD